MFSRLIEILPNVKLKLAVLKDPEITRDKELHWEVNGERGCNELHVKSFPLQMRGALRRGGTLLPAPCSQPTMGFDCSCVDQGHITDPSECASSLLWDLINNNLTLEIFGGMFSNLLWQIHIEPSFTTGNNTQTLWAWVLHTPLSKVMKSLSLQDQKKKNTDWIDRGHLNAAFISFDLVGPTS